MQKKMLSIILLSYFSEKRIESVYKIVKAKFADEKIPFEFIVIDDGSKDDSFEVALNLEKNHENVRAFQLSRNFTSQYAKFAGFSLANGECITSMPDDWQVPIEIYVKMYRKWEEGEKLVIPHRKSRNDGVLTDLFAKSYYKLMNSISDIQFPKGGADVFTIDREILEILNKKIHPINTSTLTEVLRLGFNPYYFEFDRPKNDYCKSRWTLKKKIKLAADTFFSSSSFPIKFITFMGIGSSFLSFLLILLVALIKILGERSFGGISIPGWTSTLIFLSLFSGMILLSLGIIAEYIWRIYEEVKGRPGYIIKNKDNK